MHNRRPDEKVDPSKPHLNRKPGSSTGTAGGGSSDGNLGNSGSSDDDRPTLKRRPDDGN